jgi:hypothetical protein
MQSLLGGIPPGRRLKNLPFPSASGAPRHAGQAPGGWAGPPKFLRTSISERSGQNYPFLKNILDLVLEIIRLKLYSNKVAPNRSSTSLFPFEYKK